MFYWYSMSISVRSSWHLRPLAHMKAAVRMPHSSWKAAVMDLWSPLAVPAGMHPKPTLLRNSSLSALFMIPLIASWIKPSPETVRIPSYWPRAISLLTISYAWFRYSVYCTVTSRWHKSKSFFAFYHLAGPVPLPPYGLTRASILFFCTILSHIVGSPP